MKVKVNGSELGRVAKILSGIVNSKDSAMSNIRISGDVNGLTFYATNGVIGAKMTIPMMGVEEETFCVDGVMFNRIMQGAGKEVEISTDGKTCSIKTAGRTRIPMVNAELNEMEPAHGNTFAVTADGFAFAADSVAHAVSGDDSRAILTGVLMDMGKDEVRFVALDGFRLAVEELTLPCPEGIRMVVPGACMKRICGSVLPGEEITVTTDGKRATFRTDSIEITCVLLTGEYVDYKRILPTSFQTSVRVKTEELKAVIRAGQVASEKNNLVEMEIGEDTLTVRSRSESADFEASVPCVTQGDGLRTAYNEKYLLDSLNSISAEYVTMNFNRPTEPVVMKTDGTNAIRLLLPVRIAR